MGHVRIRIAALLGLLALIAVACGQGTANTTTGELPESLASTEEEEAQVVEDEPEVVLDRVFVACLLYTSDAADE